MHLIVSKQVDNVIIIGGVAGGATAAARLRRLSESVRITIFDRGSYVSYANCGKGSCAPHLQTPIRICRRR